MTRSFTYDNQDRLLSESATFPPEFGFNNPAAPNTLNYAYGSDAADNLTTLRGIGQFPNILNQVTGDANGSNYAYDADGNTIAYNLYSPWPQQVNNHVLGYDDGGLLTSFDTMQVAYRPDGLRAWIGWNNFPYTYFIYSGDKLLYEMNVVGNNGGDAVLDYVRCYAWGASGLEQEKTSEI